MGTLVGSSRAKAREASGRREEKARGRLCGIVRAWALPHFNRFLVSQEAGLSIIILQRRLGLRNVFTTKSRTVKTEARKNTAPCQMSHLSQEPGEVLLCAPLMTCLVPAPIPPPAPDFPGSVDNTGMISYL